MAKDSRNFILGKMNKVVDERLIPEGEYIDALNVRMGSTESSEIGVIENAKGNEQLTQLRYIDGTPLSSDAKCIGSIKDSAKSIIYWFVHDPNFVTSPCGKLDMIVSYNTITNILTYHVISIYDNATADQTVLNFNSKYLITGVDLISDLIFFTDDYNQPRYINVNKAYPYPSGMVDLVTNEELAVIRKFPTAAPDVTLINTGNEENYLENKFICFAYRYRYADGQYSATSQFSPVTFVPKSFNFDSSTFLNEGMTNDYNGAIIAYNTGGPLVVGIDLLFKEADSNIIKVIEKIDKKDKGLSDNSIQHYTFTNSKIYTILPEAELLRLYDNVPRTAKAQTIMGNRLMYANYVEGYDMIDINSFPVQLDYIVDLDSNSVGLQDKSTTTEDGLYYVDSTYVTVPNAVIDIDLSGVELLEGSSISFDAVLNHYQFVGPYTPTQTASSIYISYQYKLNKSYTSVYELVTSQEFIDSIGTSSNIQTVQNSCNGVTLTDTVNCSLPNQLSSYYKYDSAINGTGQPITIITPSPTDTHLQLQFTATKYVNNLTTPTNYFYELYEVVSSSAQYRLIGIADSLHSNRDYQVGIVYMDDYGRSSTVLVSENNTQHVPCSASVNQNKLIVTIPTTQKAPYWATRYKFVAKADRDYYDTIYSNLAFVDPSTQDTFFLLEGENARKVNVGDRYIVKTDSSGPLSKCASAVVLEKASKASKFITPASGAIVPAGVYMRIKTNDFSTTTDPFAIINHGQYNVDTDSSNQYLDTNDGRVPYMKYDMNEWMDDVDGLGHGGYKDHDVPQGSIVKASIRFVREGNGQCGHVGYTIDKEFVSSANYANMKDWFEGDNIIAAMSTMVADSDNSKSYTNYYEKLLLPSPPPGYVAAGVDLLTTFFWQFWRDPYATYGDGQLQLMITGINSCGRGQTKNRKSTITCQFEIYRASSIYTFETEAVATIPDVYYENDLSFGITSNGEHLGNIQDQNFGSNESAIVDTGFFNCFAFGNGVESYKVRDSITGHYFNLGNRVMSVSAQDFREADRFSDITYSGIFNNESNVNKLNEFNLGLVNYKHCESSFGDIQIIDGRQTDVLVLQEDKISYVLVGKNLLSSSTEGGNVAAIPEVLGTQIARLESYGISFNPESYYSHGYDKYFTDTKRGVVILLKGTEYSNDQLMVISDTGMRTWFRDRFNESFTKQKVGAFDPYMDEYVLSMTDTDVPVNILCEKCGTTKTFNLDGIAPIEYCVDLGAAVGDVEVTISVVTPAGPEVITYDISATYNGTTTGLTNQSLSNTFTFSKDLINDETATINISTSGILALEVTVKCPEPKELKIIQVTLTNPADAGKYVHSDFRFYSGGYASPTQSNFIAFSGSSSNPLVSSYGMISGSQGALSFPSDGSTVRMMCNKVGTDTYNFNSATNRFRYFRSNILYDNNQSDILAMIAASTTATPINGSGNSYYADFTMPSTGEDYLYLIWDYRTAYYTALCLSSVDASDACCNCVSCGGGCTRYSIDNLPNATPSTYTYTDCSGLPTGGTVPAYDRTPICSSTLPVITSGSAIVRFSNCNCP
ncbi:structural protein [Caudoviricetes sp.]|nr:structural protein [Caudoviricetes sp.]